MQGHLKWDLLSCRNNILFPLCPSLLDAYILFDWHDLGLLIIFGGIFLFLLMLKTVGSMPQVGKGFFAFYFQNHYAEWCVGQERELSGLVKKNLDVLSKGNLIPSVFPSCLKCQLFRSRMLRSPSAVLTLLGGCSLLKINYSTWSILFGFYIPMRQTQKNRKDIITYYIVFLGIKTIAYGKAFSVDLE